MSKWNVCPFYAGSVVENWPIWILKNLVIDQLDILLQKCLKGKNHETSSRSPGPKCGLLCQVEVLLDIQHTIYTAYQTGVPVAYVPD